MSVAGCFYYAIQGGDTMKVKVIKRFYDKTNNLALCEVNKEIEVTPERAKELISKGFVKKIEETELKTTKETN